MIIIIYENLTNLLSAVKAITNSVSVHQQAIDHHAQHRHAHHARRFVIVIIICFV